jgi:triacylglycerol esterase/lipase EstA (alpha/beta hydrolase family)
LIDEGKHLAKEVASCDFYFYDFKTADNTLNGHGEDFQKFLGCIFPQAPAARFTQPEKGLFRTVLRLQPPPIPEMKRAHPLSYEYLVLVGHSMGGVVVRRALLNDLKLSGNSSPYKHARI